MNKKVKQFKTVREIEAFLNKAGSGMLDNVWENICDEYDYEDEAQTCVSEFNQALKSLKKLVS